MTAITNISVSGGNGNIPSQGEMKDYTDKVNKMDTKSLVGELGKNLEPWQRDAVEKALLNKTQQSDSPDGSGGSQGSGGPQGVGGGGDSGDQEEIAKLLKKLMKGEISKEEMQKLASLTGAKVEDLEKVKGKGGDSNGGGDIHLDIKGG